MNAHILIVTLPLTVWLAIHPLIAVSDDSNDLGASDHETLDHLYESGLEWRDHVRILEQRREQLYKDYMKLYKQKTKYENLDNLRKEAEKYAKQALGDARKGVGRKSLFKRAYYAVKSASGYIKLKSEELKYIDEIYDPIDLDPLEQKIDEIEDKIEFGNSIIERIDQIYNEISAEQWDQFWSNVGRALKRAEALEVERQRTALMRQKSKVEHDSMLHGYIQRAQERQEALRKLRAAEQLLNDLQRQMDQTVVPAPVAPSSPSAPPSSTPAPNVVPDSTTPNPSPEQQQPPLPDLPPTPVPNQT